MDDTLMRNESATIQPGSQEAFNYWVRRFAFEHNMTTDEAQEQAIIKQEERKYTGKFYDYSKGDR